MIWEQNDTENYIWKENQSWDKQRKNIDLLFLDFNVHRAPLQS